MEGLDKERKRGRPVGTGARQTTDIPLLAKVADLKLLHSTTPTTLLIKRVVDQDRDSGGVRRLQRKFKADAPALMRAAETRRRAQTEAQILAACAAMIEWRNQMQSKIESYLASPEGQRVVKGVRDFDQLLRQMTAATNQPLSRKGGSCLR